MEESRQQCPEEDKRKRRRRINVECKTFRCHRIVKIPKHVPNYFLPLPVPDIIYPKHQYMSQTIMTYAKKTVLLFTRADNAQCTAARTDISNARHYSVQLPKSFYSDSVISVFSYSTQYDLVCFMIKLDYLIGVIC